MCEHRGGGGSTCAEDAAPRGGGGAGGIRNRWADLTCLNQSRQVEISLHSRKHRLLSLSFFFSGISYDVTLNQGGQIHSPRAARNSSVSHKAPETGTKRM